jgi:hypothetical protein
MRGIAIPKRINYIFQKKSLIIFYFLSILFFIFLKKKKKPLQWLVGVVGQPHMGPEVVAPPLILIEGGLATH